MFVSELQLTALLEPDEWALATPLIWQERGQRIEVPVGFVTDLASIPAALRGVLSVTGRSRKPAVLHDYAYCAQVLSRADCDELLRRALIAEGMTAATARLYWAGVRAGGGSHWSDRAAGSGLEVEDFVSREDFDLAMHRQNLGFEI